MKSRRNNIIDDPSIVSDSVSYFKNNEIPRGEKIFVAVFIIAYIFSPIDLVPDVVPVAGWIDDVIAFIAPHLINFIKTRNQKAKAVEVYYNEVSSEDELVYSNRYGDCYYDKQEDVYYYYNEKTGERCDIC